MGYLKYVKKLWKQPKKNMPDLYRERLIQWRKEPVTVRIDRPTNIPRARSLGYKAKQGYVLVRQRVSRSTRMRAKVAGGRRPKHNRKYMVLDMNYRSVAEQRVAKKYVNCEVLSSYQVAEDGRYYWFEIVLVDKNHPAIIKDKRIAWITKDVHSKRVTRGLTAAGKRSRGTLKNKGKGAEKLRSTTKKHAKRGFQESRIKRHIL